jgi:hypothetical protein
LLDRAKAAHAFALAEQLGSVNAAAKEQGTTWSSLHKNLHPPRPQHAGAQPAPAIRLGGCWR